jgi:hypothetical protein
MDGVRYFRGRALRILYIDGKRCVNVDDLKTALGCQTDDEVIPALLALPEREKRHLSSIALGVSPRDLVKVR